MCGLFGFCNYSGVTIKGMERLATLLSHAAAIRGTHATGIAFNLDGKISIDKAAKSAYKFKMSVPDDTVSLIGHTRYTTQGSEKNNYNNHPFRGQTTKDGAFALAHNGVLHNEFSLSKKWELPYTKIKTDSYVAVQLLEHHCKNGDALDAKAMKFMGEQVSGMFTFTVLDEKNNIWIVKNDSPLSILHFKEIGLYIYASTRQILMEAIMGSNLSDQLMEVFEPLKKGKNKGKSKAKNQIAIELLEPKEGDIWCIKPDGTIEKSRFTPTFDTDYWYGTSVTYKGHTSKYLTDYYDDYSTAYQYTSTSGNSTTAVTTCDSTNSDTTVYYDMLYSIAYNMGYKKAEVDVVLDWGYDIMEVEQALYDNTFHELLGEVKAYFSKSELKAENGPGDDDIECIDADDKIVF